MTPQKPEPIRITRQPAPEQPHFEDVLHDEVTRVLTVGFEIQERQLQQFLATWLERQAGVITAALSSLPAGMAPATQASNVLAALLAAAGRPAAEGSRAELDQLAARHWRLTGLATQVALWISERDTADPGLAAEVARHLAILEDAEALKQEQAAEDAASNQSKHHDRHEEQNPDCVHCAMAAPVPQPGARVRVQLRDDVGVTATIEGEYVGREPAGWGDEDWLHIRVADLWVDPAGTTVEVLPATTEETPESGA